jgi:hypothetical protein
MGVDVIVVREDAETDIGKTENPAFDFAPVFSSQRDQQTPCN